MAESEGVEHQGPEGQGAAQQEPEAQEPEAQAPEADDAAKPKRDKPGIPVRDPLVQSLCGRCHIRDGRDHMTRISYLRKSPEGWSRTIKRMGRLHGLQLTSDAAKQLVRSLANSHGLARSEAERGLYDSERRVHWSEADLDEDFQRACAQCHPIGRALLQYRDAEEWQLLRATHVAMFPLARRQMGGGPPEEERGRRGPPPEVAAAAAGEGGARPPQRGNVGDRVLAQLTKDQPLFTPAWETWTQNQREVPLVGNWTVTGHEVGRGDVIGSLFVMRTDVDEYDVTWRLAWSDGTTAERMGKGLLYAGYSWRGRSRDPDGTDWREVLLLDDSWQTLRGRVFTGAYDEIGMDVTLHRDQGRARVIALANQAIPVPATGHRLTVWGEGFPDQLQPADFFVGAGVTVTAVERNGAIDPARTRILVVDTAAGTPLGKRQLAFGSNPGSVTVTLYDTVDYVRIRPLQGLSRVGGAKHPRQLERFEAYAVHRGKDEKPFTDDDVDLFQVRPKWALEEFMVRDDDDDLQYVGSIDAVTGVFTPNVDGPNPARKWQANNVGDVFVTCEIELDVPVRPAPPQDAGKRDAEHKDADEQAPDAPPAGAEHAPAEPDAAVAAAPPARERRTFRARSHLLVTVPVYARWQVLDWEDR